MGKEVWQMSSCLLAWGVLPLEIFLLGAATVDPFGTHPASPGIMVPVVIGGIDHSPGGDTLFLARPLCASAVAVVRSVRVLAAEDDA